MDPPDCDTSEDEEQQHSSTGKRCAPMMVEALGKNTAVAKAVNERHVWTEYDAQMRRYLSIPLKFGSSLLCGGTTPTLSDLVDRNLQDLI